MKLRLSTAVLLAAAPIVFCQDYTCDLSQDERTALEARALTRLRLKGFRRVETGVLAHHVSTLGPLATFPSVGFGGKPPFDLSRPHR